MKTISIEKEILSNKQISNEAIGVYIAIKKFYDTERIYINYNLLAYNLTGTLNNQRRFMDSIKVGLSELISMGIIEVVEDNKSEFIININKKEDKFVLVYEEEIHKIMSTSKDRFSLLRYFLNVVSTINNVKKVGFTSIDILSFNSDIQDTVAKRYNAQLEELQIIYIHRFAKCLRIDGDIRKVNNTYGRFADIEIVIKEATEYFETINGLSSIPKITTGDEARSIKQKYNYLVKKIKENKIITMDEIININELIEKYNKNYKNNPDMKPLEKIDEEIANNSYSIDEMVDIMMFEEDYEDYYAHPEEKEWFDTSKQWLDDMLKGSIF